MQGAGHSAVSRDANLQNLMLTDGNPAADAAMPASSFACLMSMLPPSLDEGWELPVSIRSIPHTPAAADGGKADSPAASAKQVFFDKPLLKRIMTLRDKHTQLYKKALITLGVEATVPPASGTGFQHSAVEGSTTQITLPILQNNATTATPAVTAVACQPFGVGHTSVQPPSMRSTRSTTKAITGLPSTQAPAALDKTSVGSRKEQSDDLAKASQHGVDDTKAHRVGDTAADMATAREDSVEHAVPKLQSGPSAERSKARNDVARQSDRSMERGQIVTDVPPAAAPITEAMAVSAGRGGGTRQASIYVVAILG